MLDATSVLSYGAALIAQAEAVRKAGRWRHDPPPISRWYVVGGLAAMSIALAAGAPATTALSHHVFGVASVAAVVSGAAAMIAVWCAGALAGRLTTGHAPRAVSVHLVTSMAAMILLWLLSGLADPGFGTVRARESAAGVAYTLIYVVYMLTWLACFIYRVGRLARHTDQLTRIGMQIARLGTATGLAGVLYECVLTLVRLCWGASGVSAPPLSLMLEGVATVLFALGSGFAAGVSRWQQVREHALRGRHRAVIARLWHQLAPVYPLLPRAGAGTNDGIHHQCVDIRDAQLALRGYMHPDVREQALRAAKAARVPARWHALVVEAAALVCALDAFQSGRRYHDSVEEIQVQPDHSELGGHRADEILRLARLAAIALDHPVVHRVRRWATEHRATTATR